MNRLAIAVIVLLSVRAARADEVDGWLEALKKPSSAPSTKPDEGDFGRRPGWIDPAEEARILAPFATLTTSQSRLAVPKLLELLGDRTVLFSNPMSQVYEVRHRAAEALFIISFRRLGSFSQGGELSRPAPPPKKPEAAAALEAWTAWWEGNKEREIDAWRREAMVEMFGSIQDRTAQPKDAENALERLARLGPAAKPFLDDGRVKSIRGAAEDGTLAAYSRTLAVRTFGGSDPAAALEIAAGVAADDKAGFELRAFMLQEAAHLGPMSAPRLVALARAFAEADEKQLRGSTGVLFAQAVRCLQDVTGLRSTMQFVPSDREERVQVVKPYEDWVKEHPAK